MPDESVLERPADVYNSFDAAELELLRTYNADVERLTTMDFFTDPTRSMGPRKPGEERTIALADVDDEAVYAVIGIFRSLFTHAEPTSFRRVINLVKRHVKSSSHRKEALEDLDAMIRWEEQELARTPIKILRGEQEFTPTMNVKAHLHGIYLHKDPDRRKELQGFPPELMRGEMLGKVYALAQVYWIGTTLSPASSPSRRCCPGLRPSLRHRGHCRRRRHALSGRSPEPGSLCPRRPPKHAGPRRRRLSRTGPNPTRPSFPEIGTRTRDPQELSSQRVRRSL
jgi:hypothetical protein